MQRGKKNGVMNYLPADLISIWKILFGNLHAQGLCLITIKHTLIRGGYKLERKKDIFPPGIRNDGNAESYDGSSTCDVTK